MNEAVFRGEILRAFRSLLPDSHTYVIPDSPFSSGTSFQHKKPYDLFLVYKGVHHGIELKQQRKGLSLPISRIEPHQEVALKQLDRAGGLGWIGINFRSQLSPTQARRLGTKRVNRAFLIQAAKVWDLKAEGKRGLSLALLSNLSSTSPALCVDLDRVKVLDTLFWDVRYVFDLHNS